MHVRRTTRSWTALEKLRPCASVAAVLASLVWACAHPLGAEGRRASSPLELRKKVEKLVDELGAETRSARTAALQSLLSLGPPILPLLPDERRIESAAVREAVGQIRLRLQRESALATLSVSRVSVRGKKRLGEILEQFSVQTGNVLDVSALPRALLEREFSVDDESRPFWSALDEIVRQAHLAYRPARGAGRLVLPAAGHSAGDELAVADSGPFRVAVVSAQTRVAPGNSAQRFLRIGWTVTAEPRLRPLFAVLAVRDLSARHGSVELKPASPAAKLELSMLEGAEPLRLETDFDLPGSSVPAAVDFHGALRIEVAAGPRPIVFEHLDAASGETQKVGSVSLRLRDVAFHPQDRPNGARIEVGILYDQGGPAFESYRGWIFRNEVRLESAKRGSIVPEPLLSTRLQGDGSYAVEYNFANVPGVPSDYRFVYVAPTLIATAPVAFDLHRISASPPTEGTKP